jgi:hypothetical protein
VEKCYICESIYHTKYGWPFQHPLPLWKKYRNYFDSRGLLVLTTTPRLVDASPHGTGYSHGCDDGKLGFHKYLNTPRNGIDYQTLDFMQGDMIKATKLALVQTALVVVAVKRLLLNQIQEVHLYRVIDHSTL